MSPTVDAMTEGHSAVIGEMVVAGVAVVIALGAGGWVVRVLMGNRLWYRRRRLL